jgi:CheY-like chemotaxis protein
MHNVLVVDDDTLSQLLLKRMLEPLGVEMLSARNALEGTRIAYEQQPSMILMDIFLPGEGGNGWSAINQIKSVNELSNIPIIVMTAGGSHLDETKAFDLGCYAYFRKPFDVQTLLTCIKNCLDQA